MRWAAAGCPARREQQRWVANKWVVAVVQELVGTVARWLYAKWSRDFVMERLVRILNSSRGWSDGLEKWLHYVTDSNCPLLVE